MPPQHSLLALLALTITTLTTVTALPPSCTTLVSKKITFDPLNPYCHRVCLPPQNRPLTPLPNIASGLAYHYELSRPLFFPRSANWTILACQDPSNNDVLKGACVGSYALMAEKGNGGEKRMGTTEWVAEETYTMFDLDALQVTVLSGLDGAAAEKAGNATFRITGVRVGDNGKKEEVRFSASVAFDIRTRLVVPKVMGTTAARGSFEKLSVLKFEVDGGHGFVIDEVEVREYVAAEDAGKRKECRPKLPAEEIAEKGPCKPKIKEVKIWVLNFDDLPATRNSPILPYYRNIHFPDENSYVYNSSFNGNLGLPDPLPPAHSPHNFYFLNPLTLTSDVLGDRFGVRKLAVVCPGHIGGCRVRILGRRDVGDGSGKAVKVRAEVVVEDQTKFKFIDLDVLAGKDSFSNLWRFDVSARAVEDDRYVNALWDSITVWRTIYSTPSESSRCRPTKNLLTLPIEKLAPGTPPPAALAGFDLSLPTWSISPSPLDPSVPALHFIPSPSDPYLIPALRSLPYKPTNSNRLFSLDSLTLTIKIPAGTDRNTVRYRILVRDACDTDTGPRLAFPDSLENWSDITNSLLPPPSSSSETGYEPFTLQPDIARSDRYEEVRFARPFKAVSYVGIRAWAGTGAGVGLEFWVQDFKFWWERDGKEGEMRERGCMNCGYRGTEWCEVPVVPR